MKPCARLWGTTHYKISAAPPGPRAALASGRVPGSSFWSCEDSLGWLWCGPSLGDFSPGCPPTPIPVTDAAVEAQPGPLQPCLTQPSGSPMHPSVPLCLPHLPWFPLSLTLQVGQDLGGLKGAVWGKGDPASDLLSVSSALRCS